MARKVLSFTKKTKTNHDSKKRSSCDKNTAMIARKVHSLTKQNVMIAQKVNLLMTQKSRKVMIARNVHSLTKTSHDCTKSSFFDKKKDMIARTVLPLTKKHDCTKSSLFDKTKTKP